MEALRGVRRIGDVRAGGTRRERLFTTSGASPRRGWSAPATVQPCSPLAATTSVLTAAARRGPADAAIRALPTASDAPSAAASDHAPSPELACEVQAASTAAELRGAAYLRAISFYTYPEGRSEFTARSHRRMKADAEWEAVTAKVEGRDEAYKDLDVICFIATVDDVPAAAPTALALKQEQPNRGGGSDAHSATTTSSREELLEALRCSLDASAQLPADGVFGAPGGAAAAAGPGDPRVSPGSRPRPRRLVVGSLDLNVGAALPSEELIGRLPQADPRVRRAYLSNVCVAPPARRLGVARALLRAAEAAAAARGVEWLYVHVVADNAPAVGLYCGAMGFQVEQTESEGFARSLQRPRRLLLAKQLSR